LLLILGTPYLPSDKATNFKEAKDLAEDHGFNIINKKELLYSLDLDEFRKSKEDLIKTNEQTRSDKPITIWLEAHGAPGWLFGPGLPSDENPANHPDHKKEAKGTMNFRDYLLEVEKKTGHKINNIILNCCYSATEFVNDIDGQYLNSPARLLSILLPDRNVIGYTAKNSGVKVSHVWEPENPRANTPLVLADGEHMKECIVPLSDASVLFRNGVAVEFSQRTLYGNNQYIQPFVLNSCEIEWDSTQLFKLCPARETVMQLRRNGRFPECFADKQFEMYVAEMKKHQPAEPDTAKKHRP
jgi:hypothetical protein